VRSVGEVQAIERAGLPPLALEARDGEYRRAGPDAVKDTVLEAGQTKSVSMPSEVFLDAGVDVDRIEGRAGSVNERRPWVEACGACSGIFEEAGRDMMVASCTHSRVELRTGVRLSVECTPDGANSRAVVSSSWLVGVSRSLAGAALGGRFEFHLISGRPHVALLAGACTQQRDGTEGEVEQNSGSFLCVCAH
jgi:hypothetical protein